MIHTHSESKILDFSNKQLYELVMEVEKYSEFLPWCKKIIITERKGEDIFYARTTVDFKAFNYDYISKTVSSYEDNNYIIDVALISGPFKILKTKWQFQKISANKTRILFDIDIELNSFFLNKIFSFFFETAYRKMTLAFEKRANDIFKKKRVE